MLNKIRKILKQQEGFTLVELMIVVVILGIISGIGIQQYGKVQENARKAAHDANVRIIKSAAQMYLMMDGNVQPDGESDPQALLAAVANAGYLEKVPENPLKSGDTGEYGIAFQATGTDNAFYTVAVFAGDKQIDPKPSADDKQIDPKPSADVK